METYRVEIVDCHTEKVVAVIGKGLDEKHAERREMTGLMRIDTHNYFVRSVKE